MLRLRLKMLMLQRGLSTNKLCEDLNISKTNFNRYKKNESQRWDLDILEKLLTYFDVNVSDLVEFSEGFGGIKANRELSERDQLNIYGDQLYGLYNDLQKVLLKMSQYSCKEMIDDYDGLVGRLYEATEEIQSIADALTPEDE